MEHRLLPDCVGWVYWSCHVLCSEKKLVPRRHCCLLCKHLQLHLFHLRLLWLTTVVTGGEATANWRKVKRKSGEGRRQASKDEKEGAGRCWDRSGLPRAYVCVFLASPRCCYMVGRPSASLCHLRKSGMQRAGVLNYLITYKDIGVLITYKKIVDRECRRGKEEPMINP